MLLRKSFLLLCGIMETAVHCFCPVIIRGVQKHNQPAITINGSMYNNTPSANVTR